MASNNSNNNTTEETTALDDDDDDRTFAYTHLLLEICRESDADSPHLQIVQGTSSKEQVSDEHEKEKGEEQEGEGESGENTKNTTEKTNNTSDEKRAPLHPRVQKVRDRNEENRIQAKESIWKVEKETFCKEESADRSEVENDFHKLLLDLRNTERLERELVEVEEKRAEKRRREEAGMVPRAYEAGIRALYDHLKEQNEMEGESDRYVVEIQRERQSIVKELLQDKNRFQELEHELQIRQKYTKFIAAACQETERKTTEEFLERKEAREKAVRRAVHKAVSKFLRDTERRREERIERMEKSLNETKELGDFAWRKPFTDAQRKRVAEKQKLTAHVRRGFIKKRDAPTAISSPSGKREVSPDRASCEEKQQAFCDERMARGELGRHVAFLKVEQEQSRRAIVAEEAELRSNLRGQIARLKREAERKERDEEFRRLDESKKELKQELLAAGQARRERNREEARVRVGHMKQRVQRKQDAHHPLRDMLQSFEENREISRKTHRTAVTQREQLDQDEIEYNRKAYLHRHCAGASRQQELELLREEQRTRDSNRWKSRFQAQKEKLVVAKLQRVMSARNNAMAIKVDSLMVQEEKEHKRAVEQLMRREHVEKHREARQKNFPLKRKVLEQVYSGAGREKANEMLQREDEEGITTPLSPREQFNSLAALCDAMSAQGYKLPPEERQQIKESWLDLVLAAGRESARSDSPLRLLLECDKEEGVEEKEDGAESPLVELLLDEKSQGKNSYTQFCRDESQSGELYGLKLLWDLVEEEHEESWQRKEALATPPTKPLLPVARRAPSEDGGQPSNAILNHEVYSVLSQRPYTPPPQRVLPLEVIERPFSTLSYPTRHLIETTTMTDDMRSRVTTLYEMAKEEQENEARASFCRDCRIPKHTNIYASYRSPLRRHEQHPLVSCTSDRLVTRSVAQEALQIQAQVDCRPKTLHDGKPPVYGCNPRLYNSSSNQEEEGEEEEKRERGDKEVDDGGDDDDSEAERREVQALELYVARFYRRPIEEREREINRLTDKLISGMQGPNPPKISDEELHESITRLYKSPSRGKSPKTTSTAGDGSEAEGEGGRKKQQKHQCRLAKKIAAAEAADRFYSKQVNHSVEVDKKLRKKYGLSE